MTAYVCYLLFLVSHPLVAVSIGYNLLCRSCSLDSDAADVLGWRLGLVLK